MDLFVVIRHYQRSRSCFPFLSLVICLSSAGDSQWTQAGTVCEDRYMHTLRSAYLALKMHIQAYSKQSHVIVRGQLSSILRLTNMHAIVHIDQNDWLWNSTESIVLALSYKSRMRSRYQWLTWLCNSHLVSPLAALFIDFEPETSTVNGCNGTNWDVTYLKTWPHWGSQCSPNLKYFETCPFRVKSTVWKFLHTLR